MRRFILRWKYTLTACFLIIVPGVTMLFFGPTRKIGIAGLLAFSYAFISEGVKRFRGRS